MKKSRFILSVLTALFFLVGCNSIYHVRKSVKHKEKALKKGAVIPKDTLRVETADTFTTIVTQNDTTYITKVVTKTVQLEPIVEVKTRWQTKYETKYKYKTVKVENNAMIDSLRQVLKLERQETKQKRIEKRSNWWIWLLSGVIIGVLSKYFTKLRAILKL